MYNSALHVLKKKQKNLSYTDKELRAFKFVISFAADRNMLIAFLGWMILNPAGMIEF